MHMGNPAVAPESLACVEAFEMASRETVKAWHTTALLSMVNPDRVNDLANVFARAEPELLAECLSNIAGSSYDAYAVKAGIDGSRFVQMSRLLIKMLCYDLKPAAGSEEILARLDALFESASLWIRNGHVPGALADADLQRIDALLGGTPEGRLALLAPLSPAISASRIVLRAQSTSYPFPRGL